MSGLCAQIGACSRLRRQRRTQADRLILLLTAGLGGALSFAEPPAADGVELLRAQQAVFRAAAETIRPCVVRIETIGGAQAVTHGRTLTGEELARPEFRQAEGPTTGVIWSADGVIVTSSFAFLREPPVITVTLADGRRLAARLVARDGPARLAVLKINATGLPTPSLRSRKALAPGQWALVLGFGHDSSEPALSVGVISAVERLSGLAVQTDARISPANYGGPLVDLEGRLIGVCVPTAGVDQSGDYAGVEWYDSGIGFAVAAEHVAARLPRLLSGSDWQPGFLGLQLNPGDSAVGEWADSIRGVAIAGVPAGPAAEAGLAVGDVLLALNGSPTPRLVDLRRVMARQHAGDALRVRFARLGRVRTATLVLVSAETLQRMAPPAGAEGVPEPIPSNPEREP